MIQRYIPKLKVGDLIEVHGFVMLSHLDPGTYRIKAITDHFGNDAYSFTRPKGKKVIRRHYVTNVDPWLRSANDPDLNKIVNLTQLQEMGIDLATLKLKTDTNESPVTNTTTHGNQS